jgi:acetyltransferase
MTRQVTGDRLAIVTNGGGIGVMAADTLIDRDGRLAALGQQTLDNLKQVLPSISSHGNPIDIAGDVPDSCYGDALQVLDHDEQTDGVLLLHCPTALLSSTAAAQAVINALRTRKSSFRQKMVLTCWLGEESVEEARRIFTENHIPTYATPTEAVRGFMQVVRYRKSQEMLMETPPSIPETFTPDTARARQLVAEALAEDRPWLTGEQSRALLRAYAIPCMEDDAAVAVKAHRPHAHELTVGIMEDALFGPLIMVGHGGVAAEVIGDRAFALPPLTMQLAHEVLARTRMYTLLQDYPGMPGADLDSIALTLMKISQLVCDIAEIAELQINPLLADDQGVLALDARVKVVKARGAAVDRLAIRPYPKELEETLSLPDGQTLLIRPIRPEDEPGYQKIFAGLTEEEIRLRFLHPMNTMSHSLAARLTQIDYDREMSLVVEGKDQAGEKELYGVVQISADPDKERAEFAIMLRHDMTGLGLGPMLLRRIINYARSQGIGELFGDVLNDNKAMLKLCRVFGFKVTSDREDPGIMQVTLQLTPDG